MNVHQRLILRALEDYRGDDLFRAKSRFMGLSEKEMNTPYGESGKTPARIIADYQAHEIAVNAAIKWLEEIE